MDALHNLRFRVETSMDYHDLRRDWFSRVSAATHAGVIVAAILCLTWSDAERAASAVAGVLTIFGVWFRADSRETHHAIQRQKYGDVAALLAANPEPTAEQVAAWTAQTVIIEQYETSLHHVVWAKCYNWHSMRIDSPAPRFRFTAWERLTAHILTHDAEALDRRRHAV